MRLRILGVILAASLATLVGRGFSGADPSPAYDPPPEDDPAPASTAASAPTPPPEDSAPAVEWSPELDAAARSSNRFSIEFYRLASDSAGVSCIVSPFSIHAGLSMTAAGTKGETLAQLQAVLHLPEPGTIAAIGDLGCSYDQGGSPSMISVANGLWGREDVAWNEDFVGLLGNRFGGAFHAADFAHDPVGETAAINAWVAERTRAKIDRLLDEPVDPMTGLILVNAIHFSGAWKKQFSKWSTTLAPFRRADGSEASVAMMNDREHYDYAAFEGFQLIALPYDRQDLEMVVLLPEAPDGLPAVEARLSADALLEWRKTARQEEVGVSLPRFRVTSSVDPKAMLAKLGVTDLFDPHRADCSGMIDGTKSDVKLYVEEVIHKSFIDVKEEGTEAAASFAAQARLLSNHTPRITFRADRPFLFLIRDSRHDTILFMGRYGGPEN